MMHGHGKSHSPIVLTKLPNKAACAAAEAVEGRGLAKGKMLERNMPRTQSRKHMSSALERIRQAARSERSEHCYHSHSLMRLGVITQGKSRMRQFRTSGSVQGAAREGGPYRDKRQAVSSKLNLELLREVKCRART